MQDLIQAKTFKKLFTEGIDELITIEQLVLEYGELTYSEKMNLINVLEKKQSELYEFLNKTILKLKTKQNEKY